MRQEAAIQQMWVRWIMIIRLKGGGEGKPPMTCSFATVGTWSRKWRGFIDCVLSCGPLSFNRKCSKWQLAWICVRLHSSVCKGVCSAIASAETHSTLAAALWAPPLPVSSHSHSIGWQHAVRGSSTCASLINHPSQWQPNRAWPIHEYFPAMAEEAGVEVELCPKAWGTPGRTLIHPILMAVFLVL